MAKVDFWTKKTKQLSFFESEQSDNGGLKDPAAMENKKLPIHRWVSWIAGFSATFVRDTIEQYLSHPKPGSLVLDPFAGVGTTLIESFRKGIDTVGFEINPFAALVSRVKLESSTVNLEILKKALREYENFMIPLERQIDRTLDAGDEIGETLPMTRTRAPLHFKSRIPFFSPAVERKVLFHLDFVNRLTDPLLQQIFKVALGAVMVSFSNYSYEPSLGSKPAAGRSLIMNAPVSKIVAQKLQEMISDIAQLQDTVKKLGRLPQATVYQKSFFTALEELARNSVDLVITSPPYLNNYHYIRNTRPHLFWLNFVSHPKELHRLEIENYGKFWQTVREKPAIDLCFDLTELQEIIKNIREINKGKGIYGGHGWANYIATYFNDTYRCMGIFKEILKPQGVAVIIVGNSIIQGIEVKVDKFFSQIAALHGLITEGIYTVREKRVGSSIVNTGAREKAHQKPELYEAAVVVRATKKV